MLARLGRLVGLAIRTRVRCLLEDFALFFRVEVYMMLALQRWAEIKDIMPFGAGSSRSANCSAHDLGTFLFGIAMIAFLHYKDIGECYMKSSLSVGLGH